MAFATNPQFKRSADGGPPLIRALPEANSQSFKKGQLVYLSSASTLTAMASDGTSVWGQALADATNVTSGNTTIDCIVVRPGDEWEFNVYQGSTDDDAASTQIGQNFALDVTSNVCTLDLNDTSNDLLTLQKIIDTTHVIATFVPTTIQYAVGY